jgi:D-cysteine desulfhydrase family pyridoxal phosphate-dependent enzyme
MNNLLTPEQLRQRLERFPQVALGRYPTPLEHWQRLQTLVNRPGPLYAKREDLSGLAFGGNKVRQLEFLLGAALAEGADVVIHGGAVQSNYCRMLAAAANKLGMGCHLVLSRAYGQPEDQGNFLLDRISGASIELIDEPLGELQEARKRQAAERLAAAGRKPFVISYPDSEVLGTLAFVKAAVELYEQCRALAQMPAQIVSAAVGSTQSGLLLGCRLLGWPVNLIGFAPLCHGEYDIAQTLWNSIQVVATKLGVEAPVSRGDVVNSAAYVGDGYGEVTPECVEAIRTVARMEGVFLDPVYTGKAMVGMLDYMRKGVIPPEDGVVFVHTGGSTALFAYNREILERL